MKADLHATLQGQLSYSQVWEDEAVLLAALAIEPGDRVLSIASAGDNAIALALAGAEVTAIDLSLPQLALTELKLAAAELPYEEFLGLLGVSPSFDRLGAYHRIRGALSPVARAYWDGAPQVVVRGVLQVGRLERFLATFRRWLLPAVHPRATIEALLELPDLDAQRRFYEERWDTRRWRWLFRLFFSQAMIARFGRSAAQFAHVQGTVAERLLERTRRAFTELPIRQNPYLEWMLTGAYRQPGRARAYLSPEGHRELRGARERIRLVHADLGEYLKTASGPYEAFNYSDLFEYLSAGEHGALLRATAARASPGARVAYWNLFVPRWRPEALAQRFERRQLEAAALHAKDRAFLYGAFQLEVVR